MRLKTLEVSGFKSFVDRTVIQYEAGVTGIVGPNGCGKSNIVDAIRWVMGEMSAKHLRGQAMEDVIFNGCESRPPVGMAQVFLTFDNSDGRAPAEYSNYSEIQVGRRLYRSGESEYFINKTICRLKDIVDLFLGTGVGSKAYSIVEQGTVGAIVSAKPEDRRILIEEAAGISKFKSRKEAALRKMESTKLNIARLNDILAELTRQINSLNRQAKKAERYQKVSEELRARELVLASTRYRSMRLDCEGLSSEHLKLKETEVSSSAELSGFESEIETKRLSLAELERELDGVQQDLYQAENSIKLYEAEINHKTKERENLQQQSSLNAAELKAFEERLSELDAEIDNANTAVVLADLKLADSTQTTLTLETALEDLRKRVGELQQKSDALKASSGNYNESISSLNSSLEHLERRHIDITGRIARDQAEIDAIDKRKDQIEGNISSHDSELSGQKQLKLKLEEETQTITSELSRQKDLLEGAESHFKALQDKSFEKRARLNSLKELRKNLEGYRDGVRAVLGRQNESENNLQGVLGTVNEFIETEPEYETALGAVLGEKLQYVVVKSHQEGVEAIDYLRTAACGRSSFIPLGVRAASNEEAAPEGEGVIGPITNFIRYADDYKHICDHLLGDVILVEDLKKALDLWGVGQGGNTFVTRDGSVVDPFGVVTGGSGSGIEEQLVAGKRKLKELEEELSSLSGELTSSEMEVTKVRSSVRSLEEQLEGIKNDSHGKDIHLLGQERDLQRFKDEFRRYEEERDRLTVELAALAEELADVEKDQKDSRDKLEVCHSEKTQVEEALVSVRGELESFAGDKDMRERELIDLKVSLAKAQERAESASRELSSLIKTKSDVLIGIGRRQSEISEALSRTTILTREVETIRDDQGLAIKAVAHHQESQRILKERYETDLAALKEREFSIRDIRKRHDEALAAFHGVELKLTEHNAQIRYLTDQIRERYHLDLPSIESQYAKDDIDVAAEELVVAELKEKVDGIGPVNVDAIQEFQELSVRQEFLSKQYNDLALSLDNLSKAIAKINRTTRQRFRRTFELVDEQFQKLFPSLFKGGQARLMLTDEENVLESGVEIIAQPPGKKLQSITLLSGGEKALTAVALIFSIFLIKPSPFCLLDEVDAPLDDANIDRFNDLIRSMTPHSQFILITHNKRTMELADLLYGVTMEERGVSKMVSVRLGADKEKEAAVA